MSNVAIIPVRGGSKSIPLKNIKPINGRPLVYWTIDAAVNCQYIDEVYVSTDSELIANVVKNYDGNDFNKLKVIGRSAETATDEASTESVLIEFVNQVESENLVLLQATSPFTKASQLNDAFLKFNANEYDSLLSVVRQKRFIWEETATNEGKPVNYDVAKRPRRQEFNGYSVENGAFYITKTSNFKTSNLRLSGKIGMYEMPEDTFFEIDEPSDWIIIEALMQKSIESKAIKLFATDCDGVLTDGGMYYSESGEHSKKFNTKDGMGFELLRNKGIITAILTGEDSQIVQKRAEKLKIDELYLGCKDKLSAMLELTKKYNISLDEVAYIGDDINDLELLSNVGRSFAVADAMDAVKSKVQHVTVRRGGEGAVREAIEILLKENQC